MIIDRDSNKNLAEILSEELERERVKLDEERARFVTDLKLIEAASNAKANESLNHVNSLLETIESLIIDRDSNKELVEVLREVIESERANLFEVRQEFANAVRMLEFKADARVRQYDDHVKVLLETIESLILDRDSNRALVIDLRRQQAEDQAKLNAGRKQFERDLSLLKNTSDNIAREFGDHVNVLLETINSLIVDRDSRRDHSVILQEELNRALLEKVALQANLNNLEIEIVEINKQLHVRGVNYVRGKFVEFKHFFLNKK